MNVFRTKGREFFKSFLLALNDRSKYWLPTNNYRRRQKLKNLNCNFILVTQVCELQLIVRKINMLAFWKIMPKKRRLWEIVNRSINQIWIFKCSCKKILNCWNLREIFFWLVVQIHLRSYRQLFPPIVSNNWSKFILRDKTKLDACRFYS